jgi:hypothetical protein
MTENVAIVVLPICFSGDLAPYRGLTTLNGICYFCRCSKIRYILLNIAGAIIYVCFCVGFDTRFSLLQPLRLSEAHARLRPAG